MQSLGSHPFSCLAFPWRHPQCAGRSILVLRGTGSRRQPIQHWRPTLNGDPLGSQTFSFQANEEHASDGYADLDE